MTRKTRTLIGAALILSALGLSATASAQTTSCQGDVYNCFILRVPSSSFDSVLSSHALTFVADVRSGDPRLVLVTGPTNTLPETTLANVQAEPLVQGFEMVGAQAMTEGATGAGVDAAHPGLITSLATTGTHIGPETAYFSAPLWSAYMNQPASGIMKLEQAHADPRPEALGLGIVAIIDTGIDPDHPLLSDALVPGYDFILEQAGDASEWNALDPVTQATAQQDLQVVADQSFTGIIDGNGTAFIEQSYTGIIDQSFTGIIDQSYTGIIDGLDLPPGFGHGTMAAGLVRLVAPAAMIMPLRVFDHMGQGDLGDIIRAIYFAVDNGANVINMSFSTTEYSAELHQAILYAQQNGVVCVSSVGNEGVLGMTYPSAFGVVIGVASTQNNNQITDFSNWGFGLTTLATPGEALVTTFPGGGYAAAWGTSFSSAVISGTVALLHDSNGGNMIPVNFFQAAQALVVSAKHVDPLKLGAGVVNIDKAMNCGPTGGYCSPW